MFEKIGEVMAEFKIEWTEEIWNRVFVEADSVEDAREKFWSGEFDHEPVDVTGGEIQESVDIEEVQ
jgi:hypothetical protein